MFIMVMGVLSCLSVPYGTLLGICTLVVLHRPLAQAFFASPLPPPLPTNPAQP
jgi:hypothetical protein